MHGSAVAGGDPRQGVHDGVRVEMHGKSRGQVQVAARNKVAMHEKNRGFKTLVASNGIHPWTRSCMVG